MHSLLSNKYYIRALNIIQTTLNEYLKMQYIPK